METRYASFRYEDVWSMPKAELHIHLDGSLRIDTLMEFLKEDGKLEHDDLFEFFDSIKFRGGMDLESCLKRFETTISVLQTQERVERVAFELAQDMFCDKVSYMEVRYCPILHTQRGYTPQLIFNSVAKGLRRARDMYGIEFGIIFSCLRERPVEDAWEVVRLAERNRQWGVVGIDLAGNEYRYPPEKFKDVFEYAHDAGLGITVHAGEGTNAESIRSAVRILKAKRIGHGITAVLDKELMKELRDEGITLEFCPTSNIHTGAIRNYKEHIAKECLDFGIKCCACTDNRLFSNTTTSKEYYNLAAAQGLSLSDVSRMNCYAWNAAFRN